MQPNPKTAAAPVGPAILKPVLEQLDQVILGKPRQVRLSLACLLARGHLLIEDLPGMGKTTLAHTLAAALGLQFKRIQFTSDLLPADIIGVSIYKSEAGSFEFHPGPVFAQVVLADEINRATPKAQSALLEAMEERQVSSEGKTWPLPEPFFVIATQNPHHLIGTFPLPESQLDRFLLRIEMGYPDRDAERALLKGSDRRAMYRELKPALQTGQLLAIQQAVTRIHVADALVDYVQNLLAASRSDARYAQGLSPRAGLGLLQAARAWAFLAGRDMVLPEDVQAVAPSVMAHRLQNTDGTHTGDEQVRELIERVAIP
jgi:MoxR-like ATPase